MERPNTSPEVEPKFTISEMTVDDIEPATVMRLQSWLDTYVNDAAGVTREWVEAHNDIQRTQKRIDSRKMRFIEGKQDNTFSGWVAKDSNGVVIAATTPTITEENIQQLGSLYVDKNWHGKGVGSALMQEVISWFDPTRPISLQVAAYNDNAQQFYKKWGFEKVPDTDMIYENVMPEFTMIRKAQNEIQS